MITKTVTLTTAQWEDIQALIERGESDLASYSPRYAEQDGYTQAEIAELDRLSSSDAPAALAKQLA